MEGLNGRKWRSGYVLRWDRLLPGDIILSRHSKGGDESLWSAAKSKFIRVATGGEYSHAMLYFTQSIIHATPPGVFSTNPQRLIACEPDAFRVLRYAGLSDEQRALIELFAREKVGTLYHIKFEEAMALRRQSNTRGQLIFGNRQFCSRLVAQAYGAAGVKIVPNPYLCTPSDFLKCSNLQIVDAGVVNSANENDLAIVNSHDFAKQNLEHTFRWLKEARRCGRKCGVEIQTVNDAIRFAQSNSEADKKIAQALESSGYLTDWADERGAHEYRYKPALMCMLISAGKTSLKTEVVSAVSAAFKFCSELMACRECLRIGKCMVLAAHETLYMNLLDDIVLKLNSLAQVSYLLDFPIIELTQISEVCKETISGRMLFEKLPEHAHRFSTEIQAYFN